MTTDQAIITAEAIAPFVAKLPAHCRDEFGAGRKAAEARAALDEVEREALLADERDRLAEEARVELRAQRAAQRWSMWCSQVPSLYADDRADAEKWVHQPFEWWLSRLDPGQHPAELAAWLGSDSSTLLMVGPTGTGKTHAAITLGYAAAGRAVHCRYLSQLHYLAQLRPGGSDDPGRVRWNAANTNLLILDDLGAETEDATQFVRQEVCDLLEARLSENRRQVITTNSSADELADTFGDRIVSRLRDRAVVIRLDGDDRRRAHRRPW